jgi:hypothetical protein
MAEPTQAELAALHLAAVKQAVYVEYLSWLENRDEEDLDFTQEEWVEEEYNSALQYVSVEGGYTEPHALRWLADLIEYRDTKGQG